MTDIKRNFSDIASPANLDDTKKLHVDSTATTKVGRNQSIPNLNQRELLKIELLKGHTVNVKNVK